MNWNIIIIILLLLLLLSLLFTNSNLIDEVGVVGHVVLGEGAEAAWK